MTAFLSNWQSMVWIGGMLGTPGLAEVRYDCSPDKPESGILSCTGPLASTYVLPGSLRASFYMATD